jgi:hypothetical protein
MSQLVCECAKNWRVELTLLTTGRVVKVLTPVSFEFQTVFQQAGQGTITFNRNGVSSGVVGQSGGESFVRMREMYPKRVGIYFSRIAGGAATPASPVNMFGGVVTSFRAGSDGLVTLGFVEIQSYLDTRLIRSDLTFTNINQNSIAANLVEYANGTNFEGGSVDPDPGPGINLIGGFGGVPTILRDRTYLAADRKYIGEALADYLQILNGPVYRMEHFRNADLWVSEMFFSDDWLQSVPYPTIAWHHLTDFEPNIDSDELANLVDAFGRQEEGEDPFIETTGFVAGFVDSPRYDAAPVFDTVTEASTLSDHAFGYLNAHQDTNALLQLMFSGLDYGTDAGASTLSIDDLMPGNFVNLDIHSPNWAFVGGPQTPNADTEPRIGRLSVAVGVEGPEQVTAQVVSQEVANLILPVDHELEPCFDC